MTPSVVCNLAAAVGRPFCVTCGKTVEHAETRRNTQDDGVTFVFECHGKGEAHEVDGLALAAVRGDARSIERLARRIPRRVFLRGVAAYTIRPKHAEGRRA